MKVGRMKQKEALALDAADFIKWLSHRKGWHARQYRTACMKWRQLRENPAPPKIESTQPTIP